MEAVFSKDVQAGLDQARVMAQKRASRLRVRAGMQTHPVLRMWKTGFAVEASTPALRGFVNVYDGENHQFQCLIVTSADDAGERHYEFKRATAIADRAAVDFELPEDAPVALIGKIAT